MSNPLIDKTDSHMKKSLTALRRELSHIRAGRANVSLLNGINVDCYGTTMPLNQVASISTPEARVLMVSPFDKSTLKDIEKSLLQSDLGINPANDGSVIRLVIPQLTGERRQELVKEVNKIAETAKISIRNIRREAMDEVKKQQKKNEITDDELHDLEKQVQKVTDKNIQQVDTMAAKKSQEITAV